MGDAHIFKLGPHFLQDRRLNLCIFEGHHQVISHFMGKTMINPGVLGGTKFSDIPMWVICIWSARNNKNQDERSGGMHSFTHNLFTAGRHQSCSLKNACNMERSVLWLMATTPPTLVEISTTTLPRTTIDVEIIVVKLHKMIPRVVFNNGVRVLNPHPSYSGMLQCARQVR